ncbi:fumarate reductase, partial [Escherichia coli EC96038]
LIGVVTI